MEGKENLTIEEVIKIIEKISYEKNGNLQRSVLCNRKFGIYG